MTPIDLTTMAVDVTVRFAAPIESVWNLLTPDHGGSTLVTQKFRHGPGRSGVSEAVEQHPEHADLIMERRSTTLRTNMNSTLEAAARLLDGQRSACGLA